MISFIIIGKNIEKTIAICMESVFKFINTNNIGACEVIYVDSNSNDKTLEKATKFPVRVFQVSGNVNAAIARNVGAKYAKGESLFFIDGDMELFSGFYKFVFDINTQKLKYPFTNGYWEDRYYDGDFKFLHTNIPVLPATPEYICVTGGLMILERSLWEKVGGMDEKLIRHQDHDIGLRITALGFPAKRYNHLFAIHHTVKYTQKNRALNFYLSRALLSSGLLLRKHLFNYNYFLRYRNTVFYIAYLLITFLILFLNPGTGIVMFGFYILIQLVRVLKNINQEKNVLSSFLFKTLFSFYGVSGFLFYFPKNVKYKVTKIQ